MTDVLDAEHRTGQIRIHDAAGFEGMRVAGKLAAECFDLLTPHVVPGAVTEKLDDMDGKRKLGHGLSPLAA